MSGRVLYIVYNIVLKILLLISSPFILVLLSFRRYRTFIRQKFGFYSSKVFSGKRRGVRIWFNAASVGEVRSIGPLIKRLKEIYPESTLFLSIGTMAGMETAEKLSLPVDEIFFSPMDVPFAVKNALSCYNPDLYITTETEIWPNFIGYSKKRGVTNLMVNGRISSVTYPRYLKIRPLIQMTLKEFELLSMRHAEDADRIINLGAPPARVKVSGNFKYDSLSESADEIPHLRPAFNLRKEERLLVAGSTRTGEEEIILRVYKRLLFSYPDLKLLLAPRHVERRKAIKKMVISFGLEGIEKTEIDQGKKREREEVIILDTIGELFKVYSMATVVFCGASLVRKGGQNILEPAIWGKVPLYGPHMDDFLDARRLLESVGAGIQVRDEEDLYQNIRRLLSNPELLEEKGRKAKEIILSQQGAVERNANLISQLITERL